MLKSLLIKEKKYLEQQMLSLQKEIDSCPPEHLLCVQNGNYVKWYKGNGINPIYIPKKNRKFAEELAVKKYCELKLNELKKEFEMIEGLLKQASDISRAPSTLLAENPSYKELLDPYFLHQSEEIQGWLKQEEEGSPSHPENLIHQTYAGHLVRSKSEVMIANTLYLNHIPYKYEKGISLGSIMFFPDFTILHPGTKTIYYWEHFGMMDHSSYRENAFRKLKYYGDYDIYPMINLITTIETAAVPLNSHKIEQLVQDYFL